MERDLHRFIQMAVKSISFSLFPSLPFSYTIRSEVKQAALRWVCSSLTPHLQATSGQDEERGERKEVQHGAGGTHSEDELHYFSPSLYSNRAVRQPLCVWKVVEALAEMVEEY